MKRTGSGRGSQQLQGILEPRNEDFTPKNRQSVAQKTYIPKMGQIGSAKQSTNRRGRSSIENIGRPSLLSSRFTPVHLNTPAFVPQSANRLSMDSARSSGIGASTRKEMRYVSDTSSKNQCISKILDFLRSKHQNSYQRHNLHNPTSKDFTDIFTFIIQHLDPTYTLPTRYEEEIPKLLKKLYYPVPLTKSSFVTIGSRHTWPAILAAMAFLVDFILIDSVHQDNSAFPSYHDDVESKRLHCFVSLIGCNDEEEVNACFEIYYESLRADNCVKDKDMMDLEEEVEEAEHVLESLSNTADELREVKQTIMQCSDDLVKLVTYLQDLQIAIQYKAEKENEAKQKIQELNAEMMKVYEEGRILKSLQVKQGYSNTELINLKNHCVEAGKAIEHQEQLGKNLSSQRWAMEIEILKAQSSLRDCLVQFEDLLEKVGLNADFHHINISIKDLDVHQDDIMCRLMASKKTAKKNTSQAQEEMWKADQDIERVKGRLQEEKSQYRKLDTKLRHIEEELEFTQEEMAREEQLKLEELELLHQKIMEARKARKNPIYHMQQMEDKMKYLKQEAECYKKKEKMCWYEAAQFLDKLYQERLRSLDTRKKMIAECISSVDVECDQLFEWFNLQN